MKERIYTTEQPKYFCPHCHREVNMPFKGMSLKSNTIKIGCGSCGKGAVIIKVPADKKPEEAENL